MIILDTCVLILDSLTPKRLSKTARDVLANGEAEATLACADISLWEIAMLIRKDRIDPATDAASFCGLVLAARGIRVLPITPAIAADSVSLDLPHGDPADRLIAATARAHAASLLTCDEHLRATSAVTTLW